MLTATSPTVKSDSLPRHNVSRPVSTQYPHLLSLQCEASTTTRPHGQDRPIAINSATTNNTTPSSIPPLPGSTGPTIGASQDAGMGMVPSDDVSSTTNPLEHSIAPSVGSLNNGPQVENLMPTLPAKPALRHLMEQRRWSFSEPADASSSSSSGRTNGASGWTRMIQYHYSSGSLPDHCTGVTQQEASELPPAHPSPTLSTNPLNTRPYSTIVDSAHSPHSIRPTSAFEDMRTLDLDGWMFNDKGDNVTRWNSTQPSTMSNLQFNTPYSPSSFCPHARLNIAGIDTSSDINSWGNDPRRQHRNNSTDAPSASSQKNWHVFPWSLPPNPSFSRSGTHLDRSRTNSVKTNIINNTPRQPVVSPDYHDLDQQGQNTAQRPDDSIVPRDDEITANFASSVFDNNQSDDNESYIVWSTPSALSSRKMSIPLAALPVPPSRSIAKSTIAGAAAFSEASSVAQQSTAVPRSHSTTVPTSSSSLSHTSALTDASVRPPPSLSLIEPHEPPALAATQDRSAIRRWPAGEASSSGGKEQDTSKNGPYQDQPGTQNTRGGQGIRAAGTVRSLSAATDGAQLKSPMPAERTDGPQKECRARSSSIQSSNKLPRTPSQTPSTENRVIMAATVEKLVEKLTSEIDYTFLTDFFLIYRLFITPMALLNLFMLRFHWALIDDSPQQQIVRIRTFVTLRHWLLNYFGYDFMRSKDLRRTLNLQLQTLAKHPIVMDSTRDQRIVRELRRYAQSLKKIHYRNMAQQKLERRTRKHDEHHRRLQARRTSPQSRRESCVEWPALSTDETSNDHPKTSLQDRTMPHRHSHRRSNESEPVTEELTVEFRSSDQSGDGDSDIDDDFELSSDNNANSSGDDSEYSMLGGDNAEDEDSSDDEEKDEAQQGHDADSESGSFASCDDQSPSGGLFIQNDALGTGRHLPSPAFSPRPQKSQQGESGSGRSRQFTASAVSSAPSRFRTRGTRPALPDFEESIKSRTTNLNTPNSSYRHSQNSNRKSRAKSRSKPLSMVSPVVPSLPPQAGSPLSDRGSIRSIEPYINPPPRSTASTEKKTTLSKYMSATVDRLSKMKNVFSTNARKNRKHTLSTTSTNSVGYSSKRTNASGVSQSHSRRYRQRNQSDPEGDKLSHYLLGSCTGANMLVSSSEERRHPNRRYATERNYHREEVGSDWSSDDEYSQYEMTRRSSRQYHLNDDNTPEEFDIVGPQLLEARLEQAHYPPYVDITPTILERARIEVGSRHIADHTGSDVDNGFCSECERARYLSGPSCLHPFAYIGADGSEVFVTEITDEQAAAVVATQEGSALQECQNSSLPHEAAPDRMFTSQGRMMWRQDSHDILERLSRRLHKSQEYLSTVYMGERPHHPQNGAAKLREQLQYIEQSVSSQIGQPLGQPLEQPLRPLEDRPGPDGARSAESVHVQEATDVPAQSATPSMPQRHFTGHHEQQTPNSPPLRRHSLALESSMGRSTSDNDTTSQIPDRSSQSKTPLSDLDHDNTSQQLVRDEHLASNSGPSHMQPVIESTAAIEIEGASVGQSSSSAQPSSLVLTPTQPFTTTGFSKGRSRSQPHLLSGLSATQVHALAIKSDQNSCIDDRCQHSHESHSPHRLPTSRNRALTSSTAPPGPLRSNSYFIDGHRSSEVQQQRRQGIDTFSQRFHELVTLTAKEPCIPSIVLWYRSELIAQQLCLIERELLSQVQWYELVDAGWTKNAASKADAKKSTVSLAEGTDHQQTGPERRDTDDEKRSLKSTHSNCASTATSIKNSRNLLHQTSSANKRVARRDESIGIKRLVERFNLTCQWVASEIVRTQNLDMRVKVVEKFIRIAYTCYNHSNFSSLVQITVALQTEPVERLTRTWARVRAQEMRIMRDLVEFTMPMRNWKHLRDAMKNIADEWGGSGNGAVGPASASVSTPPTLSEKPSGSGNGVMFFNKKPSKPRSGEGATTPKGTESTVSALPSYFSSHLFHQKGRATHGFPSVLLSSAKGKEREKETTDTGRQGGCIPFLALYLSDLVFNSELPSYVEPAGPDSQPMVNVHKHRTTATIIKRILTFRTMAGRYPFRPEPKVREQLMAIEGLERAELIRLSNLCEERASDAAR